MTNKGLIPFKFTDKQSDPVEIGDFEWNTDRRGCIFVTTESDRCDAITCFPKKKSPTILYNCLSMGTIALLYETNHFSYLMWNGSCGNNSPWVCVHHKKEKVSEALTAIGIPKPEEANGEVSVEIVDSFVTDLSDPKNTLIEDAADAANVKIEGKRLWLSKKVLVSHSPFFAGLFKNNFEEGADCCYDLKGLGKLNLEVFFQFYGIIHGLKMPIVGKTVESLLELADLFQCKMVLRFGEEFLRNAPEWQVSLSKKLLLADRFKLHALLLETANKMPVKELKMMRFPSGTPPLVVALMAQKFCLKP